MLNEIKFAKFARVSQLTGKVKGVMRRSNSDDMMTRAREAIVSFGKSTIIIKQRAQREKELEFDDYWASNSEGDRDTREGCFLFKNWRMKVRGVGKVKTMRELRVKSMKARKEKSK